MKRALLHLLGLPRSIENIGPVDLVFRGTSGTAWIILLAIALGIGAFAIYRLDRRGSITRRTIAAAMRAVFFAMILGLFLRPTLRVDLEGTLRRALLLLVDDSASMKLADPRTDRADRARALIALGQIAPTAGIDQANPSDAFTALSRSDLVKAVLRNDKLDLLRRFSAEYDVRPFTFSQNLDERGMSDWNDGLSAAGSITAEGDALRDLLSRTRGQPLAGVVLIGDGASNAGSPLPAAAEIARRQGVPLYAYGVGVSRPLDAIVSSVSAQEIAFVDDVVTVSVRVRSSGMDGRSARIALKLDDDPIASQEIIFTGGEQVVALSFTPKRAGERKLIASIEPAPDEIVKENNTQSRPLRIVDAKIKVLLVEQQPRWEFKYLQAMLLRDRRVKLDCVLMEADPALAAAPGSPYRARFPARKEELFEYDLIIFGDVEPRNLTSVQLDALHEFVANMGGGLVMIAGHRAMPAAYRGTPIEKMLPVEIAPASNRGSSDPISDRPIRLELTPAGKRAAMMRLADSEAESESTWLRLPPIFWTASVGRAKPAAEVLLSDATSARDGTKTPVIAMQQYGLGQVCFVGTDNTWRWRRNDGDRIHSRLWGQIVQRLSLPHLLGESKRTQLSSEKRSFAPGERITLIARLFTETFEPLRESTVRGSLTSPTSSTQSIVLRAVPDQPGQYRAEFSAPSAPGAYSFSLERDPQSRLNLVVEDPKLELSETAMNEPLLKQIAATSGGVFFREEDLYKLPDAVRAKAERIRSTLDIEIWSSPAYFLAMLAVIATEWILRKSMQMK